MQIKAGDTGNQMIHSNVHAPEKAGGARTSQGGETAEKDRYFRWGSAYT